MTHPTETADVMLPDKAHMLPRMEAPAVQACAVEELIVVRGAEASRITTRQPIQMAHYVQAAGGFRTIHQVH